MDMCIRGLSLGDIAAETSHITGMNLMRVKRWFYRKVSLCPLHAARLYAAVGQAAAVLAAAVGLLAAACRQENTCQVLPMLHDKMPLTMPHPRATFPAAGYLANYPCCANTASVACPSQSPAGLAG